MKEAFARDQTSTEATHQAEVDVSSVEILSNADVPSLRWREVVSYEKRGESVRHFFIGGVTTALEDFQS